MKQLFLFILICLSAVGADAATLSGTVTDLSLGGPRAGVTVHVRDSFFTYHDSAATNASGAYSITLPAWLNYGRLIVTVSACGNQHTNRPVYSGGNVTSNFSVCAAGTVYNLHGTVTLSGTANNGLARIYLIRQSIDSLTGDTTLAAIDSFNTAGTGGTFSRVYSSLPSGVLRLKAALLPSHPEYGSYLPTYYTNALVWSSATFLTSANFSPANPTNITMTAGINPGGAGFISGSVVVGANKWAAVGDALPNRILLLTTSTGAPVKFTYSDTNGNFYISDLVYGTYKIFGDALGKTNPALTFTVTQAKPGINDIIFEENDHTFKGRLPIITSSVSSSQLEGVALYPNPVTDRVFLTGLDKIGGKKWVALQSLTGARLMEQAFDEGQQVTLTTGALPAGIYVLHLQTERGTASFRFVR